MSCLTAVIRNHGKLLLLVCGHADNLPLTVAIVCQSSYSQSLILAAIAESFGQLSLVLCILRVLT